MDLKKIPSIDIVTLGPEGLSMEEFCAVVRYHAALEFSDEVLKRMAKSSANLRQMVEDEVPIYGVTTGFGNNVSYRVSADEAVQLQKNLLRTHAVSVGAPCTEEEVRAIILMIILNLSTGVTGVQPETIERLRLYLNRGYVPYAPSDGSVGYLSVEGHIALTLIGEGYFLEPFPEDAPACSEDADGTDRDANWTSRARDTAVTSRNAAVTSRDADGTSRDMAGTFRDADGTSCRAQITGYRRIPASSFLPSEGLSPIQLSYKEGLSLISGTTSASALGLLAILDLSIAYRHIELADTAAFETLHATDMALDARLHALKKHPEQEEAASQMRSLLHGSKICEKWRHAKVQDAYVLRAMPQIHGAILKTVREVTSVFEEEMHSCSDNPVILEDGTVLMTGNFDGTFIAQHADYLTIAAAKLAGMAERVTDRLVNTHINDGLPPFLAKEPGTNNGFMILQYTQAALTAEVKLLAAPASTDSITTCAGQEDPVSMDYRSSQKALEAARKLKKMAAIELLTVYQAMDLRGELPDSAPAIRGGYETARKEIAPVEYDRYLYADIETMEVLVDSLVLLP